MITIRLMVADHSGLHVVGVPEQPVLPVASNAYSSPESEATNAVNFPLTVARAGEDSIALPVAAVPFSTSDPTFEALIPDALALKRLFVAS